VKIAMVTATFPPYRGGTGHAVYYTARELVRQGYQVTVYTPRWPGRSPSVPAGLRDERAVALARENGAAGIGLRVVRLTPWLRTGNASWLPALKAQLMGYDVIHLHYPDIFGAVTAARQAQRVHVPLVITLHNRLVDGAPSRAHWLKAELFSAYEQWVLPWLWRRAAALVVMSEDQLASWPWNHPRIRVVPHGVDTQLFSPMDRGALRRAWGLSGRLVLLFVGALDAAHRFKNLPLLLRALSALPSSSVLLIAGDGTLRGEFERMARQQGLGRRVHFFGTLPPDRLPSLYNTADVTVLPSVSTESFGLVLLESLAVGTPVVASALPGVRSVVRDGQDGWLVRPGSMADVVRVVKHLGGRPELRAMGRRGRRRVVDQYSWQRAGGKLARVYDEVASRGTHDGAADGAGWPAGMKWEGSSDRES